jgi:hypothetical protein
MQAVMRMNAEQASKNVMWEPTRSRNGEGRCRWGRRAKHTQWFHRGSGDGMYERRRKVDRGSNERHGKPWRCASVSATGVPRGTGPGRRGWRRGP